MAVRQKAKVLEIAHGHFKDFGLPLDIEYKSYLNIVGSREALSAISVKRSFKAWKYLLHALKIKHPELAAAPEPAPAPKEAPKPKKNPLEALSKAASAEKMSDDDE